MERYLILFDASERAELLRERLEDYGFMQERELESVLPVCTYLHRGTQEEREQAVLSASCLEGIIAIEYDRPVEKGEKN